MLAYFMPSSMLSSEESMIKKTRCQFQEALLVNNVEENVSSLFNKVRAIEVIKCLFVFSEEVTFEVSLEEQGEFLRAHKGSRRHFRQKQQQVQWHGGIRVSGVH